MTDKGNSGKVAGCVLRLCVDTPRTRLLSSHKQSSGKSPSHVPNPLNLSLLEVNVIPLFVSNSTMSFSVVGVTLSLKVLSLTQLPSSTRPTITTLQQTIESWYVLYDSDLLCKSVDPPKVPLPPTNIAPNSGKVTFTLGRHGPSGNINIFFDRSGSTPSDLSAFSFTVKYFLKDRVIGVLRSRPSDRETFLVWRGCINGITLTKTCSKSRGQLLIPS